MAGPALWVGIEALSGSLFSSIGLLLIAALIGPSQLGLSAIALGIIQAVNFFPDTLFHDAIIQRRRVSALDLGSAFWSVTALSALLTIGVIAFAPLAAATYGQPALTPLLMACAATIVPTGIASIQTARLRRRMRFQTLARYAMISRAFATVSGLSLALGGFGAWAAIAQYASSTGVLAAMLVLGTRWRYCRSFSFRHVADIGAFACARTAVHFVDLSRGPIFFVLMGRLLPLEVLGQVNFAFRLVDSITRVLATAITRLLLPIFSRVQQDRRALAELLLKASSVTAAVLVPPLVALSLLSGGLVGALASERWLGIEVLVPWLCVAGIVSIIETPAAAAILATGRPMMLSVVASLVLALLLAAIFIFKPTTGVAAVACWTVPLLAGVPVYAAMTKRAVSLTFAAQLSSTGPALLISCLVAISIFAVRSALSASVTPLGVAVEVAAAIGAYLLASAGCYMFDRQRTRALHLAGGAPAKLSREFL